VLGLRHCGVRLDCFPVLRLSKARDAQYAQMPRSTRNIMVGIRTDQKETGCPKTLCWAICDAIRDA
jgi:hypothetical protein